MSKRRDKKLIEALTVKARALAGSNDEKALPLLEKLCELEPDRPRWLHKIGETYEALGDTTRAMEAYQKAVARYTEQGQGLKAIVVGRQILSLDPTRNESHAAIAAAYTSRSEPPGPFLEDSVTARWKRPPPDAMPSDTPLPPVIDESLDSLPLSRLPTARHYIAGPGESAVFEIPLDDLEEPPGAALSPEQLPPTPLFSSLDQDALRELIERVEVRHPAVGDEIYSQGDQGDSLFVLVEGRVGVYRDGLEIGRLDEGAFFGEIALLTKLERWASVRALSEPCTLLEISRQVTAELVKGRPQVLTVLLRFFRTRLIDGLIETSPLFAPFSGPDRHELVQRFGFVEADPGCDLLVAGEQAGALYILLTGRAEVSPDGQQASIQLGSGDLFGEAPLLTGEVSAITIRTTTKCWLLKLDRAVFLEVIMTHPQVLEAISDLAADREQGATGGLRRTVTMA